MPYHGATAARIRKRMAATLPAPCWRCGTILYPESAWTVGHMVPRALAPELELDETLMAPECARCNYREGARLGNRLRGMRRADQPRGSGFF